MTTYAPVQNSTSRDQITALTGVRGYGFLLVFLGHYLSTLPQNRTTLWGGVLSYVIQVGQLAVPGFFVLSGFLIGGILFKTRNREGFFRVFYGRRILRVFPVYYIALLVITCVDLSRGVHLGYGYWAHFLYLQNYMPGYTDAFSAPNNQVAHLWSLAIEEQFYFTFPFVVWLAKDRKTLLRIVIGLCALCWLFRIVGPPLHLISVNRSFYATPTRVDTILFGVALALIADSPLYKRLIPFAKYITLAGVALWLLCYSFHPHDPSNYFRLAVEFTICNLTVAASIAAVMEEGSKFARVCSYRWVCWLGMMSYAMYVFHYTYRRWFLDSFRPALLPHMSALTASIVTALVAFGVTLALGIISYHFVETPALALKKYLKHGPERTVKVISAVPALSGRLVAEGE